MPGRRQRDWGHGYAAHSERPSLFPDPSWGSDLLTPSLAFSPQMLWLLLLTLPCLGGSVPRNPGESTPSNAPAAQDPSLPWAYSTSPAGGMETV